MKRSLLKSKVHHAIVTNARLNYEDSVSIDKDLCNKADSIKFEKVDIYNIPNEERFSTYVIFGNPNEICLNGAAARKAYLRDSVIILSYGKYDELEWDSHKPKILLLDSNYNAIKLENVK